MKKHCQKTLRDQVRYAERRRLINAEYRRGFVEGQHEALMLIADCMDKILANHNDISTAGGWLTTVVSTKTDKKKQVDLKNE